MPNHHITTYLTPEPRAPRAGDTGHNVLTGTRFTVQRVTSSFVLVLTDDGSERAMLRANVMIDPACLLVRKEK